MDIQGRIAGLGVTYLKLSCFSSDPSSTNSFLAETVLYILFPILVVLFTAAVQFIAIKCESKRDKGNEKDDLFSPPSSPGSPSDSDNVSSDAVSNPGMKRYTLGKLMRQRAKHAQSGDKLAMVRSSAAGVAVITLFLLFPTLVKQFAQLFSCVQMGREDSDMFLIANLDVRCFTAEHNILVAGLGLPLLILYVLGVPYALYKVLSSPKNRPKVSQIMDAEWLCESAKSDYEPSLIAAASAMDALGPDMVLFKQKYAFLFLGYKQELYLWEIVIMARKGVLSLIGVALASDQRLQIMVGLLTIFLSTIAHARYMPFEDDSMNHFEFLSLCSSAMTFFFGVFTVDGGVNGAVYPVASIFAMMVNVGYVLIAIPYGIRVRRITKQRSQVLSDVGVKLIVVHAAKEQELKSGEGKLDSVEPDKDDSEVFHPEDSGRGSNSKRRRSIAQRILSIKLPGRKNSIVTKEPMTRKNKGLLVVTLKSFKASKPTQMSFMRGDIIQVVNATGKWHRGILVRTRSQAALTGKVLFYPPNLVRPATSHTKTAAARAANDADLPVLLTTPIIDMQESKSRKDVADEASGVELQKGSLVAAKQSFKAEKPVQMSFMRGDIIQVVNATGKWSRLTSYLLTFSF